MVVEGLDLGEKLFFGFEFFLSIFSDFFTFFSSVLDVFDLDLILSEDVFPFLNLIVRQID